MSNSDNTFTRLIALEAENQKLKEQLAESEREHKSWKSLALNLSILVTGLAVKGYGKDFLVNELKNAK